MSENPKYDVSILGGGLAGLTLAIQLIKNISNIKILILDKRSEKAPIATHKVGESFVELGSIYLREKIGLAEYIDKHHLPKYGIRFFFDAPDKEKIEKRIELGSKTYTQVKTNQVDRGIFENDLLELLENNGVDVQFNSLVKDVEINDKNHFISYQSNSKDICVQTRWLIDASGRNAFLKKKLNLAKPLEHSANAVWFRVNDSIDVNDWSQDKEWTNIHPPGRRKYSTTHLMGKGYWVWIIPLSSGATSIGIVTDPNHHDFNTLNSFEKTTSWLKQNEPYLAKLLINLAKNLLDFKVMRDFSYDIKRHFSEKGWAVTGESGTFVDPLYSPGTDFIALSNTWITKLIHDDYNGENVKLKTLVFNHKFQELIKGWTLLYKDKYHLFDKPQVLTMKVAWDWGTYWGNTAFLFKNDAFVDIEFLKNYSEGTQRSLGTRFARLNESVQKLFEDWGNIENSNYIPGVYNIFDNSYLKDFQFALLDNYNIDETFEIVTRNMEQLELMAAELFRIGIRLTQGDNLEININPYKTSIFDSKEELIKKSLTPGALAIDLKWKKELEKLVYSPIKLGID